MELFEKCNLNREKSDLFSYLFGCAACYKFQQILQILFYNYFTRGSAALWKAQMGGSKKEQQADIFKTHIHVLFS